MCADRGVATELRPDEIDDAWFADCSHLHVSGYALLREPVRFAAAAAIGHARAAGARVSVDLSSWSAIRDYGAVRFRADLEELAPDVVFANEDEERDRRRPRSPAAPGSSSAAPPAPRSTASSVQRSPVERRSTRRGRATPSPPAGSSAGRTSRSRPRRAACSRRGRCRTRDS